MRSRALLVLGVVLVALSASLFAVGVAAGENVTVADADEGDAENVSLVETVEVDDGAGPYGLEELRQGGSQQSGAPPSVRAYGTAGAFWIEYEPTGFVDNEPRLLEPGETVIRDTITFRSTRAWNAEPETVEVVVVYWKPGFAERETENGVVQDAAAIEQVVDRHEIQLGAGYDENEIGLRPYYDDQVEVTMWVEGVDGARWRFEQTSSDAGREIGISSRGDAVLWATWVFFLPAFVTTTGVVWFDRRLLSRAAAGPGYGLAPYIALGSIGAFFASIFWYDSVIEILSRAPWLLGITGGLIIGIFLIELFGDDTFHDLFVRFDLEQSEIAEDGSGIMSAEVVEKRLVDQGDGRIGVIETGLRQFYARARGAMPILDTGPLQKSTEIDVNGRWRKLHLVHPAAEQVLEYEPPSWEIDVLEWPDADETQGYRSYIPEIDTIPVAIAATILVLGWSLGGHFFGSGLALVGLGIAVIPALAVLARPIDGRATVRLAPAHFDAVIANMLKMAEGFEETVDREYFKHKYYREQGKNLADRKIERERGEKSRMESVMDRLAPPDANGSDADVVDEGEPADD